MSEPQRIQLSRKKGWRKPEGAVVVARPSRWGNPFKIGDTIPDLPNIYGVVSGVKNATAKQVVDAFRLYAPVVFVPIKPTAKPYRGIYTIGAESLPNHARRMLRGKDLACWCPLDQPCHADVLLELANPTPTQGAA